MKKLFWQQGDVIIEQTDRNIDFDSYKEETYDLILAEGEVSGHVHRISQTKKKVAVMVMEPMAGLQFLQVLDPKGATITHEEHLPITIPKGAYVVRKVREYDHFTEEIREVKD